ncbi:hypothetical protein [Teichococcus aerofrigidensis]
MADDGYTISDGAEPPPTSNVVQLPQRGGKKRAGDSKKGDKKERPRRDGNARDDAIEALLDLGATFWRDARGDAYATVPQDDRLLRFSVRGRDFKNLLRLVYGDRHPVLSEGTGRPPRPGAIPDQALSEAIGACEAMALRGEVRDPRPRVCRTPNGVVWLDLGDETWRLVKITAEGWEVVDRADVPLIRPGGLMPLPVPQRGDPAATLASLATILNLRPGDGGGPSADLRLSVAWLVACLCPEGPFPILAVDGEQGSGKTTASKMLRRLVDPNHADARAAPREERDLVIAARNSRVLSFDNLSSLDSDMADALCRIASGGGFGERMLYSNGEEHTVHVCNPCLLNGIPSLLARGDLADRAISITLPPIPDDKRKPEAEVWRDFEAARASILALLLDGLRMALARLPGLHIERLPRMADFARLCAAMAPAFGWTEADMLEALEENRAAAVAGVIEADSLAIAVRGIAVQHGRWEGLSSELLAAINLDVPLDRQRQRDWPKDSTRLSARLRRIAPALRRGGVEVVLPSGGGRAGRKITLHHRPPEASQPGAEDAPPPPPSVEWSGDL